MDCTALTYFGVGYGRIPHFINLNKEDTNMTKSHIKTILVNSTELEREPREDLSRNVGVTCSHSEKVTFIELLNKLCLDKHR